MVVVGFVMELLLDEYVLLVDSIAFAKSLGKSSQQIGKLIIVVNVGRVFLDGVLQLQNGRVLASLSIEHTDAIHILYREVDVLEYLLALTASSECFDRGKHTQEDCCKCYDYV